MVAMSYNTHTNLWDEVRSVMFPGAISMPSRSTGAIKATTIKALDALEDAKIPVIRIGENTWMIPRKALSQVRNIIEWVHSSKKSEKPTK